MKAIRHTQSARADAVLRSKSGEPFPPAHSAGAANPRRRLLLPFFALMVFVSTTITLFAQDVISGPDFKSIVVFGDSLSDTGNVAHLTQAKYGVRIPGAAADYTDGRFTDGADTEPMAEKFSGVWIEQYAASLPSKPAVTDSLDGGTNYSYGFATTRGGTSAFTFGTSDALYVDVDNIGTQISSYLATSPQINDKTLFVVWGGAIDVLYANSYDDVIGSGIDEALNIQRLVDAGATEFIIPNLPPLGLVPRLNGSPKTSIPATEGSELYNDVLALGLSIIRDFNPGRQLHLSQLDVYSLFNKVVASPSSYSLVNVTASSQGAPVDPDTYLFWDDLHPTTHGHNILAVTAAKVIAQSECSGRASRDSAEFHSACDGVIENGRIPAPR